MSINVNAKKIVIGIVVLLVLGGSVLWWNSTKDARKAKAEYKMLVKLADRQAVEIAIIEQSAKLTNYKQQIAATQQAQRNAVNSRLAPVPLGPSVVNPVSPPDKE